MEADRGAADLSKIDEELSAGRLWRAKEMLQGRLAQAPFDERLLEKYGTVLLSMGDELDAGRYLFASGVRRQEYEAPIGLFLSRFGKANSEQLMSEMPSKLRRRHKVLAPILPTPEFARHGYTETVLRQLDQLSDKNKHPSRKPPAWHPIPLHERAVPIAVGFVILAIFVVGFYTIVRFFISAVD
ncbi:hypothetical protein QEZ47_08785 [Aminobacter anthyllidis]|uniref:DUF6584 family protein n=1 Tax=Aminobacter anthyllidis TaxID=1035067 RepID=UPI00245899BF|nr:DUF6584 family protein [Aminobacter anthyllidis]MDH4985631.1 hypothetical protein [Aminobacter anthyllidis]